MNVRFSTFNTAHRLPVSRGAISLALCGLLGCLAACASRPELEEGTAHPHSISLAWMMGAPKPLTTEQSRALLGPLALEPGDAGLLPRHVAIENAVAETPLLPGNRTCLLRDGAAAFQAMFRAIRGAAHYINLEYFIFEDVASDGEHLGDLLIAKRQQGVSVNVIYDSFGSAATPAEFFDRLKTAQVNLLEFRPLNPLQGKHDYSLNDRDHRKILIVDGATGIIGGVNLSTTYESSPSGSAQASAGRPAEYWRDTDLQIDGPAVAQLQQLFRNHWIEQTGKQPEGSDYLPTASGQGIDLVRILGSTPKSIIPRYYVTLLSAIRNAEKKVWLTAAYFVPTHEEEEDLLDAARRGVDVRLLVPGESDSKLAIDVGRSHYADLLEAGVEIYETHGFILHAKTVTVDGVWSAIGSSNFDQRSVLFNDEVDAIVLSRATANGLQEIFEDNLGTANRIDLSEWEKRPLLQKLREYYARLWATLL